jgi:hypothetical protein
MKFFSSPRQQVTRVLGIAVVASLSGLLSSLPSYAQTASPTAAPTTKEPQIAQSREEWRAAMSRFPMPKKGCFTSTYPRIEWQEVQCATPPPTPYAPKVGPRLVGSAAGQDYSAQVPDTLSKAVGSFDSITGVSSESDYGSNSYSLQLNTNTFKHALCNQATNPNPNCQAWQQFLYSTAGIIYIQYWLLSYGDPHCPTNWTTYQNDQNSPVPSCYRNSPATIVSPQPSLADLAQVTLTGEVSAGLDAIILTTGSGPISGSNQDSVLNLSQNWAIAEFNIFGDGNFSQAYFNLGSTIVVRTTVNDGTTNAPLCDMLSFTGETNNLFLAPIPCSTNGGPSPAIVFTESFFGLQAETSPFINTYALHDQQHFAYLAQNGEIWDLFYCPDCSNAGWQLQNINTITDHGVTNGPPAISPPFVDTYVPPPFTDPDRTQQHFAYLAANGDIWDSFYCPGCSTKWQLQKINNDGVTKGAGMTKGPPALSAPFVNTWVERNQQHFAYLAANGDIWDAFYCPECSKNWQLQKINNDGMTNGPGMTKGPPALFAPFVVVDPDRNRQHFAYLAANGDIWDSFYCPDCSTKWQLQKINNDGVTNGAGMTKGPPALSAPFVNAFSDQQHFAYLAHLGQIWDAYYCPKCSGDNKWLLQQLTGD